MFNNALLPKLVNIVKYVKEIIVVTVSSLRYSSSNYLSLRIGCERALHDVCFHVKPGILQCLNTHRNLGQVHAVGHDQQFSVSPLRVEFRWLYTAGNLLVDEGAVVVFQHDVQRVAVVRIGSLEASERRDLLQLYTRTRRSDARQHIAAFVQHRPEQHGPVTDDRVDGSRSSLRAGRPRVDAADTRHEHLQRGRLGDDPVALLAMSHDVVPRFRDLVVIDSPHDAEREDVMTECQHRLQEMNSHCALYSISFQHSCWVFGLERQNYNVSTIMHSYVEQRLQTVRQIYDRLLEGNHSPM